jgi:predicted SAM-dependent methyltransferase
VTLKQRFGQWLIPRLPVNRRTFDIVRFELNAFAARLLARMDPATRRTVAHMANERGLRVNLGSGGENADSWISLDVQAPGPGGLRWDIRRRLPFADGSVAQVYASHVVEHLEFKEDVPALFAELYRVLQSGGRVRIVVPDVARYLEAYVSGDPDKWIALGVATLPDDIPTPMAMINHVFHQGGEHQFGYDFDTLAWLLRKSGFDEVFHSAYRDSIRYEATLDLEVHAPYSLYVEAVKGGA